MSDREGFTPHDHTQVQHRDFGANVLYPLSGKYYRGGTINQGFAPQD